MTSMKYKSYQILLIFRVKLIKSKNDSLLLFSCVQLSQFLPYFLNSAWTHKKKSVGLPSLHSFQACLPVHSSAPGAVFPVLLKQLLWRLQLLWRRRQQQRQQQPEWSLREDARPDRHLHCYQSNCRVEGKTGEMSGQWAQSTDRTSVRGGVTNMSQSSGWRAATLTYVNAKTPQHDNST